MGERLPGREGTISIGFDLTDEFEEGGNLSTGYQDWGGLTAWP
jgi:hypothetical protein